MPVKQCYHNCMEISPPRSAKQTKLFCKAETHMEIHWTSTLKSEILHCNNCTISSASYYKDQNQNAWRHLWFQRGLEMVKRHLKRRAPHQNMDFNNIRDHLKKVWSCSSNAFNSLPRVSLRWTPQGRGLPKNQRSEV